MSADPEDFDMFVAHMDEQLRKHDEETRRIERERVLGLIEADLRASHQLGFDTDDTIERLGLCTARIRKGEL